MTCHARTLALAAIVSAAVTVGGAVAQPRTDPTLNRLAAEFQTAYNARDAERVATFYAEDAVTMPPNRPVVDGRAAIAATLRRNLEKDPATMVLTPIESAIVGDRAYEVGTRVMTWASGLTLNEKYMRIYKRAAGEWKIAYWIWNSDSAAGPPG